MTARRRPDRDPELARHVARLIQARVDQGLPRYVEDPDALARVAAILRAGAR